MMRKICD
ncbi:hypothetical protein GQ607_015961 [Colletotrichum asianum]|nr:hypothetical protein GQ607_015961 [Colletotrichum asianum]